MITLNNSILYIPQYIGIIINSFSEKKKKNGLLQIHININRSLDPEIKVWLVFFSFFFFESFHWYYSIHGITGNTEHSVNNAPFLISRFLCYLTTFCSFLDSDSFHKIFKNNVF